MEMEMEMTNQTGPKESFLDRARKLFQDYKESDRVVSSIEFAEIVRTRPRPKVVLKSGMVSLDEGLDNIIPGEVTVISGPTGMGKTLLCDTLIRHMRSQSHFSVFFSFEVTPETIALAHDKPETVIFLPLEHKGRDIYWIFHRILESKAKFSCEAVFIDHLHYLIDMGTDHNMSLEIGKVMRQLKTMALEAEMAIFIVCHVKKLGMEREPCMDDIRDSSFVGQEADNVLMVWRRWDLDMAGKKLDSRLQGLATVKVEKARRKGTMGLKIPIKKNGHILVESKDEATPEQQPETRTAYKQREWQNA